MNNIMNTISLPKKFQYIDVDLIKKTYDKNGPYLYVLINSQEVIYIGRSSQVISRLLKHKCDKIFDEVAIRKINKNSDGSLLEAYLIFKFTPRLNNAISPNVRFLHFRRTKDFNIETGYSLNVKFVGRYPYFDLREIRLQNK